MSSNDNFANMDDVQALSEYIGHTISRLLDVLQVRGTITKEDREYVSGQLDADTWYKKATTPPDITELFKQMFDSIENNKEKPDEN
jgi:hypothetical protein